MNTTIINLHAGPGAGKSQTAWGVGFYMKLAGIEVEYVPEYAKELTWGKNFHKLKYDQRDIFDVQKARLDVLLGQVQYIVTDSPLLLSMAYLPINYPFLSAAEVMATFETYNNVNFFINRVKPYNPNGRNQTPEQAKELDLAIESYLRPYPYYKIDGDADAPHKILKLLK
jgi:hypothetical protein